jgi:hypothetical protein
MNIGILGTEKVVVIGGSSGMGLGPLQRAEAGSKACCKTRPRSCRYGELENQATLPKPFFPWFASDTSRGLFWRLMEVPVLVDRDVA